MTAHEPPADRLTPEPGSDRAFGIVVGGIFLAIAIYLWWAGVGLYLPLGVGALTLVLLGLIYPASLTRLNRLWTRFGLLLGRVVSPLVLAVVYVTTVIPTGLLLRLFGKDLLTLKLDRNGSTYWVERDPRGPAPESLRDQF